MGTIQSQHSRISAEEIATEMALSLTVVYRMLQQRTIPNIRVGRQYIISREAFTNWWRNCGMPQVSSPVVRSEAVQ